MVITKKNNMKHDTPPPQILTTRKINHPRIKTLNKLLAELVSNNEAILFWFLPYEK
jgi:hypothetical protein